MSDEDKVGYSIKFIDKKGVEMVAFCRQLFDTIEEAQEDAELTVKNMRGDHLEILEVTTYGMDDLLKTAQNLLRAAVVDMTEALNTVLEQAVGNETDEEKALREKPTDPLKIN